ncbi:MAG: hypothetical protein Q4A83_06895 [Bacillota bacterium]|nr:hypothetical protein [Bacillota bacterium]
MKKFVSVLLVILCIFAVSACGDAKTDNTQIDFSKLDEITGKADPTPTSIPTPPPTPTVFSGYGDDVITIDDIDGYVFHITGNSASKYFSVTAYDRQGNYVELLVSTTDEYDGVVIDPSFSAYTFEIKSTCEWSIELVPLSECEVNK